MWWGYWRYYRRVWWEVGWFRHFGSWILRCRIASGVIGRYGGYLCRVLRMQSSCNISHTPTMIYHRGHSHCNISVHVPASLSNNLVYLAPNLWGIWQKHPHPPYNVNDIRIVQVQISQFCWINTISSHRDSSLLLFLLFCAVLGGCHFGLVILGNKVICWQLWSEIRKLLKFDRVFLSTLTSL